MLFQDGSFAGFGPNNYDPLTTQPIVGQAAGNRSSILRDGIRKNGPKQPGVYGMLDPRGRLIYVGKAKNLRARLLSYFRPASRDPKAGRIVAHARTVIWEHAPSEFAALLRELELIRQFRPSFNVQGQPTRRLFKYLCLGRSPAAYCYIHREASKKALAVYGPLPGSRRLFDAVRRINDFYRLRDCPQSQPMTFADQPQLFPIVEPAGCLRYEIGTCLGPCVAAITRTTYSKAVRAAKSFLDGRDDAPVKELKIAMEKAAAAQSYEQAATIRDRLDDLEWLQARLAWLTHARQEYSFIYPVESTNRGTTWHLIRGGRVLTSVAAPNNVRNRREAFKAINAVFPPNGGPSIIPGELYDHVLLVASWFRRKLEERARVIPIDRARQMCIPPSAVA